MPGGLGTGGRSLTLHEKLIFGFVAIVAFVCLFVFVLSFWFGASNKGASSVTASSFRGQEVYAIYCAQCHGDTGDGEGDYSSMHAYQFSKAGRYPPPLAPRGDLFPEYVSAMVRHGSAGTYSGEELMLMPPFADTLSDEQIEDVATFVTTGLQELAR